MSVMFCQRRSRSFLRHHEMIRSISAGTASTMELIRAGSSRRIAVSVETVEPL